MLGFLLFLTVIMIISIVLALFTLSVLKKMIFGFNKNSVIIFFAINNKIPDKDQIAQVQI